MTTAQRCNTLSLIVVECRREPGPPAALQTRPAQTRRSKNRDSYRQFSCGFRSHIQESAHKDFPADLEPKRADPKVRSVDSLHCLCGDSDSTYASSCDIFNR